MEKDTQGRGVPPQGNTPTALGELWEKMEKETDLLRFTLLCEEFAREGGVKAL